MTTLKHLSSDRASLRLKSVVGVFILAGAYLATAPSAHAARQVTIRSPSQFVNIGGVDVRFEARIVLCTRRSRGFGFVTFESSDGTTLRLLPVSGAGIDLQSYTVFVAPEFNPPANPDEIVGVFVSRSPQDPERLIWDFAGNSVFDLPPPFEAEGGISVDGGRRECEPADFGQIDSRLLIDVPLQRVEPFSPSDIIGIEALVGVGRDQETRGFFDVYLPRETRTYNPLFGAAIPDRAGNVQIVLFLLLADREGPLATDAHLLRATIREISDDVDCMIWDLINGTTGEVNGMFEALGEIQFDVLEIR